MLFEEKFFGDINLEWMLNTLLRQIKFEQKATKLDIDSSHLYDIHVVTKWAMQTQSIDCQVYINPARSSLMILK